jgi:hypothetical protein
VSSETKVQPRPDGLRFRAPLMQEYVAVPRAVMRDHRLSSGARMLYTFLCDYARERDRAWPGEVTLGRHMGCGDRQIRRYLSEITAMGLVTVTRETRTSHNQYLIEADYGAGLHPDLHLPTDVEATIDRTDPTGRERTEKSGASGHPRPPKEKQGKSSSERAKNSKPGRAEVDAVIAQLQPLIDSGRLNDPTADGSEMAIIVALQGPNADLVDAAVQRIAGWAADGTLRRKSIAGLLPTALEQSRAGRRHTDGTSGDRPAWDDTVAVLKSAVSRHGGDQLAALRDLAEHYPSAARFVVEIGGWTAWCDGRTTGNWSARCLQAYQAMTLDPQPVTDLIAQLEENAELRRRLDAGENPYDPKPGQ